MLVVVRALCGSQVEWHSQPADLVLINSIHCSSVNARPAILDMGPPSLPISNRAGQTRQNRTKRQGKARRSQLNSALIFENNDELA